MVYWKFLHILFIFTAISLFVGVDLMFRRAAAARDVAGMRKLAAWSGPLVPVAIVTFLLGVGFGFVTAIVGAFDLTQPWLILAYVLVGLILVLGAGVESPYQKRIERALEASPGDASSPELEAVLGSPVRHVSWVSLALYVAVIFDMVVKPI